MAFLNQDKIDEHSEKIFWENRKVGITGASGTLGMALAKVLREKGSFVFGITHRSIEKKVDVKDGPNQWVHWHCGNEKELDKLLGNLDILILNHGINPGGNLDTDSLNKAIEVNALSNWRLIESFAKIALGQQDTSRYKEIWINTSEAEIQPAFSPSYEISKRLIGQLVSFKYSSLTTDEQKKLRLKKLILGPFRSQLNPIGIMNADFVANTIINKSIGSSKLVIVTPNPITYLIMPLTEMCREIYFNFFKFQSKT